MEDMIHKNKEIALMLGAKEEQWYPPNKHQETSGIYLCFPLFLYEYIDDKGENCKHKWYPDNVRHHGDYDLKFHSDANWQYEVINWIENEKGNAVEICQEDCTILTAKQPYNDIIHVNANTKKEAVFEALYQFSQFLKQG